MANKQIAYIGHPDRGELVEMALNSSGMDFTCVDEESLDSQSPGDVIITESSVRFAPNETPVVDLGNIVQIVHRKLERFVPIIIIVSNEKNSQPEVAGLPSVRVVENRKHLSRTISELLQPTT